MSLNWQIVNLWTGFLTKTSHLWDGWIHVPFLKTLFCFLFFFTKYYCYKSWFVFCLLALTFFGFLNCAVLAVYSLTGDWLVIVLLSGSNTQHGEISVIWRHNQLSRRVSRLEVESSQYLIAGLLLQLYRKTFRNNWKKKRGYRECPCGVMVKVLDCRIIVHEFELLLRYYVHF